jgi:hypothetical protein
LYLILKTHELIHCDVTGEECLSAGSDMEDLEEMEIDGTEMSQPASPAPSIERPKSPQTSSFLDLTFWKR